VDAAARAAWPYAQLCAWTYLNDHPAAHDIMDHAVEIASGYIARHTDYSDRKLLWRIKSVLKRRAQQLASKRRREISVGSFVNTRVLERTIAAHGKPQSIRSDNGPELTSRHYLAWAIEWKIDLVHIQPGKPTQNGGMVSRAE
jgi:hypothetical protein